MEDFRYQSIIQFLQNELSDEERLDLEQWRRASPSNEQYFQETKFLWQKSKLTQAASQDISIDVDAALKKVHHQLPQEAKVVNIRKRRRFLQVSVAVVAVLITGMLWLLLIPSIEMIEVNTLANEQKEIMLPDSSIVWLNENSRLSYPAVFHKNKRAVTMNGDLVFEVKANPAKPFQIKSDDLVVQVLGTKFNVISDPNKKTKSLVHVLHGKVKVQQEVVSDNHLILKKGMTAMIDEENNLAMAEDFSANRLFWLNKKLEFDESSLGNVFADLEYIFKVKLEIENSKLLDCEFSGKFEEDIDAEKILNIMTSIFNIEIEKVESDHFKIKNGAC